MRRYPPSTIYRYLDLPSTQIIQTQNTNRFNIYTFDLPPPSAPVQVMAYADDITITSTYTTTSAAKKYIQPCLHKVSAWTKQKQSYTKSRQNNLPPVHTRPCRIYEQSGPQNTQHCTTHGNAPKSSRTHGYYWYSAQRF